ncbi:MAG: aminotransferase class IV [Bacteroidales bacterium]|nr:aminotransferase class IV [Bacteroidales bacterium]
MDNTTIQYISYNGKIIAESEFKLNIENRAFQYGDGLFETMHASGNKVQFFYEHMERLIRSMKLLKMEVPVRFSIDTMGLQREISKLLIKNKLYKGARIRMSVYRQSGGFYMPDGDETEYIMQCSSLPVDNYELNYKGMHIDLYEENLKPINNFSTVKLTSSIFFVIAGIFKRDNNLDECIILNSKGNIVEGISSNIFVVKEKTILTPSIREGCLPGIMRQKIIELARKKGFSVQDEQVVKIEDIMAADEIFFTNAVKGIQWVLGFKQRRFYNKVSKTLSDTLNQQCFPELISKTI